MNFIGQYVFIGHQGKLMSAEADGSDCYCMHVLAEIRPRDRWNIYQWPDDKRISLLNYGTNKWLCAQENGTVVCNRSEAKDWEKWTMVALESNKIALKSFHGKWLCAERTQIPHNYPVIADREHCKEWEKWTAMPSVGISDA